MRVRRKYSVVAKFWLRSRAAEHEDAADTSGRSDALCLCLRRENLVGGQAVANGDADTPTMGCLSVRLELRGISGHAVVVLRWQPRDYKRVLRMAREYLVATGS
jgi:hypothetical protein